MYPIKSCRGIALTRARVGPRGIIHDREWMIVAPDGRFLTQRAYPQLAVITSAVQEDRLRLSAPGTAPLDIPLQGLGREMEV
ncbi:MAG: MOSC domain-containing protein, partial [Chloroflexota bacterium]|nr:MOSC domain-containing protein [Chloroflexota bacterium]